MVRISYFPVSDEYGVFKGFLKGTKEEVQNKIKKTKYKLIGPPVYTGKD